MTEGSAYPTPSGALTKELACHGTLIIAGWSDASSGPLIPYIQAFYGISYTVVSMLFVGQMVGFLCAGFLNGLLTQRWGLVRLVCSFADCHSDDQRRNGREE